MNRTAIYLVTALAMPGLAMAQDNLTAEEITVFGGARDERGLLETPNSVSTVDQEEIERRQASTYEELIGDIPGVTIGGGPRGISQEPNIRGFTDEQIVLRVDGARQNFNLAHRGRFFTDPEVLKRVEVVRGGNSTLFGSGALGGVIILDTKDADDILDPDETWALRLKGGYNSQGNEFVAATTLAARADDFDILAFFSYRPMFDDLNDGRGNTILNSEIDSMNGLFKLGWEPGDHRFEFSIQHYRDEGLTPPNANATSTPTTVVNRRLDFTTARLEWDWNPEESTLIDVNALIYFNIADVTEDRPSDGRSDATKYTTFGFELVNRSEFELGVPIQLSYGIEVYQDNQDAERNGGPRLQAPNATARYYAGFAQADVKVMETVTVTPGIRFDYFDVDPDGNFASLSDGQVSPKVAVQWRPVDPLQFWLSASRSFRAPSLTELYNDGTHFSTPGFGLGPGTVFTGNNIFIPTPDLKPERATSFEIGTRFEKRDVFSDGDKLSASGNAYSARVDDYVDTVVTFIDFSTATFNPFTGTLSVNGSTRNRNIDAHLWGFEAELNYDSGYWFAGVGLTIPRGQARNGGSLGSISQDRLVLSGGFRPIDDVEVGGRATLLAGRNDAPAGGVTTPGTALFDIWATYRSSQAARMTNLEVAGHRRCKSTRQLQRRRSR